MSNSQRRVVLLTGASRGLGRASAIELCRRGWHVIAAVLPYETGFVPLDEAVSGFSGELEYLHLDLLDESSIDDAGLKLADAALDAVVHNAGLGGAFGAFEDTPIDDWQKIFQVNLLGPMRLTAQLLPSMRARGSGRIVAVSSYSARIGIPFASVYGASKAGLERWIETLAVELHSFGLSAHALELGMFATDMVTESAFPSDPDSPYRRVYDRIEPYHERIIARAAKPPEVFARMLANTLEAKNPPIIRPVGADSYAIYATQHLLPSRLAPAIFRLAFR